MTETRVRMVNHAGNAVTTVPAKEVKYFESQGWEVESKRKERLAVEAELKARAEAKADGSKSKEGKSKEGKAAKGEETDGKTE